MARELEEAREENQALKERLTETTQARAGLEQAHMEALAQLDNRLQAAIAEGTTAQ